MQRDSPFRHPAFPIYLVTRLAAYDLADVKAMIDRSLAARNRGKFVIDLQSAKDDPGNDWLRTAAMLLPAEPRGARRDDAPALQPDGRDRLRQLGLQRRSPYAAAASTSSGCPARLPPNSSPPARARSSVRPRNGRRAGTGRTSPAFSPGARRAWWRT